jgi:tetratricopeptide (TPR) repeat protein
MSEMINPYIAGAPVTERTMFFGRHDIFDWVQRSLAGKFVDHILVIHGQRRVGKTSVLKQIPFHLPPTYIPVFFDLQGRTRTTIDRFLWRLGKEITRTLRATQSISLPESSKEDYSQDPEFFQNRFLPQLGQAIGDRRLLLLFDEFDSLEEPTAREMLAQDLIPYFSRLMHAPGPLAFIFSIGSSGRKLEHMQASYTDFFRIALYKKISFLKKEEATRLITQPVAGVIEYTSQAVENIFNITSGHPYFTQLLCHELFGYCQKTGKRRIALKDIEAVLDDVVERGTVNLKFVWDDASDPERYVLTALSVAEDGRHAKSVHQFLQGQKVRITQREVADSLRHLQQKDVLTPDNSFTVDLMRLWLLENKPLDRVIEELMEVSPIATRYIEIAEEFHETGLADKALDSYRSALEMDPENLTAQVGIASLILERGDLSQAADEYQRALDIDLEDIAARSGFCQTHLALADQLRAEGQTEEALEHYRQVLTVNEQQVEARERLAAHHSQLGARLREGERFDEAIEAFQRALEFTPDEPVIAEHLAETQAAKRAKGLTTLRETAEEHFRAERLEQAIASFEEYLSLEPEDEEATQAVEARLAEARGQKDLADIYRQGQAALNERRYGEAVGLFKEIINRDVSYKDATRLLAQAVELRPEAGPWWKDIRVLAGAGGVLCVIIAVFLFRLAPSFPPAPTPIPDRQIRLWADDEVVPPGGCTILHWDVHPPAEAFLDGEGVPPAGEREVCPEETRPCELSVPETGQRHTVTLHVEGPPPPPERQIRFGAADEVVPPGGCTILHWDVHPPAEAFLDGEGVPPAGEREVCPEETRPYELFVPETGQRHTVMVHVEAPPPPPEEGVRISFNADRTNLRLGECTTLRWSVEGGFGVELNGQPVERSGQSQVCPPETTPYVIAVDAADRLERREVVIFIE